MIQEVESIFDTDETSGGLERDLEHLNLSIFHIKGSGDFRVFFGNTGLMIFFMRSEGIWRGHYQPFGLIESDNEHPEKSIYRYSLGMEQLLGFYNNFNSYNVKASNPKYIHGETNYKMNSHRKNLFGSIDKLFGDVAIYHSSKLTDEDYYWRLNLKALNNRISSLSAQLNNDELLGIKYFNRLEAAHRHYSI